MFNRRDLFKAGLLSAITVRSLKKTDAKQADDEPKDVADIFCVHPCLYMSVGNQVVEYNIPVSVQYGPDDYILRWFRNPACNGFVVGKHSKLVKQYTVQELETCSSNLLMFDYEIPPATYARHAEFVEDRLRSRYKHERQVAGMLKKRMPQRVIFFTLHLARVRNYRFYPWWRPHHA